MSARGTHHTPRDDEERINGNVAEALMPSDAAEAGRGDAMASAPTSSRRFRTVQDPDTGAELIRDPADPEPADPALCCCLRYKYAFLMAAYTFISTIPSMVTSPIMIDVQRDYFGSDQKAAMVKSVLLSVVAIINLFLIVAYGRLLDSIGRKPFFIASSAMMLAQYLALAIVPKVPIIFLLIQAAAGLIQSSFSGAWVADMIAPEQRAFAFTIIFSTGTLTMIASLPVGLVQLPNIVWYIVAVVFSAISLLFAIFVIPESLPAADRKAFSFKGACENPLSGAKVLLKSRALTIIAGVSAIVATSDVGTQDVYMYYLNQRVGFTKEDNSIFFTEMALLAIVGYFVVAPLLMRYISNISVLCLAIGGNGTMLILIGTVWARWCVFAFVGPFYGILILGGPVLSAMVTNIGHERDVGKRVTAMTAVSDFCNAVGPLVFGSLYANLPTALIALPFFVFGGLCLCTVALIWMKLGPAIRSDQEKVQAELLAEAAENGEAVPDENDPTSPIAIGRGLYNEEDCQ